MTWDMAGRLGCLDTEPELLTEGTDNYSYYHSAQLLT